MQAIFNLFILKVAESEEKVYRSPDNPFKLPTLHLDIAFYGRWVKALLAHVAKRVLRKVPKADAFRLLCVVPNLNST